jgi:hypothetical protein
MVGLRKLFPVFGRGTFRILNTTNRKVLAYLRQYRSQTVLCVANISRSAQPVLLDLNEYEGRTPVEMLGYVPFPKITDQPYVLSLSPYAFLWFELQLSSAAEDLSSALSDTSEIETLDTSPALVRDIEEAPLDLTLSTSTPPAKAQDVEVRESQTELLIVIEPASREDIDKTIAAISARLSSEARPVRTVLAYPRQDENGAALPNSNSEQPQTLGETPWLRLTSFVPNGGWLPFAWPHTEQTYFDARRLATEHEARATMLLSNEVGSLDRQALPLLLQAVLHEGVDLAMPRYTLSPYEGLLNGAILFPLTRALYGSAVRYPLGGDLAFSTGFCQDVGGATGRAAPGSEDRIVWPATEAVLKKHVVAQVQVGRRRFAQPESVDVTALLTRIVGSLFSDIETRALEWQMPRPLSVVREIGRQIPIASTSADDTPPADVTRMMESFRLAGTNLQEVWAQVMPPRTLLSVKRLAELRESKHSMPDLLWVRIVYDFLVAYRERKVNRSHLVGALMPLYLGWAASHVLEVGSQGEAAAEQRIAALASVFEADKPYLVARWRWPDRFNP